MPRSPSAKLRVAKRGIKGVCGHAASPTLPAAAPRPRVVFFIRGFVVGETGPDAAGPAAGHLEP
jgi:hypothetical protein